MSKKNETYEQSRHRFHAKMAKRYDKAFPRAAAYHRHFADMYAPEQRFIEPIPSHAHYQRPYRPGFRSMAE